MAMDKALFFRGHQHGVISAGIGRGLGKLDTIHIFKDTNRFAYGRIGRPIVNFTRNCDILIGVWGITATATATTSNNRNKNYEADQ
jgi:hypothetical protein